MAMAQPPPPPPPVSSSSSPTGIPGKKIPRNPAPLSAPQEQQVRDLYYANARAKCDDEIKAFATCATGRTISGVWACRPQKLKMNGCLLQYQNQDEMDRAREEWFSRAGERKKAREEEARRVEDLREMKREWWRDFQPRDEEGGDGKGGR